MSVASVECGAAVAARRARTARAARRGAAMLAALAMATLPGACGTPSSGAADSAPSVGGQPQGPTITIAVAADLPGLGYLHDGTYAGFDIALATYVAKALGYARKQIIFAPVQPRDRAEALASGDADMVVAGYTMSAEHAKDVTFAGPYLTVRPASLTRDDEPASDGPDSVPDSAAGGSSGDPSDTTSGTGRATTCVVNGTAAKDLAERDARTPTVAYDSYAQCMTALMVGSADAIAGDDAVLRGLSDTRRGHYRVVAEDGDDLGYGIAVARGRTALADKIAAALRDMIRDGSWRRALDADLAPLGYRAGRAPDAGDVDVR
ncbi:transporter substrate-binding domain-containing protein [Bifidobacterium scardovii]|uniref:transporter substrate-binding domain-containing protein n=2 Tax=Bifidobacterium scardovii TaxID=158787 RepID=UPI00243185A0|nr:transporter substrate-binding domain-containing protein [Bifidobacterium scardovii]MBS6947865.1 transporter substrate-binding domain-containing protein [Bifidobacterium scardovii]